MQADAAERLPYVDEHSATIEAGPEASWDALVHVVERSFDSARAARGARLLGCAEVEPVGPRPLSIGSTVPGFRVASAERPARLALVGRHRFSSYALVFRLHPASSGTRLTAETRAEFPRLAGRLYRAMVIGTHAHALVTQRLLAAVKHRAEPVNGLCDSCTHQQLVPNTRGSVFSLCLRSRTDERYPRYPRVPVLSCPGHERRPAPAPPR